MHISSKFESIILKWRYKHTALTYGRKTKTEAKHKGNKSFKQQQCKTEIILKNVALMLITHVRNMDCIVLITVI